MKNLVNKLIAKYCLGVLPL